MSESEIWDSAHRFGRRLGELGARLDEESFAVLLRVLNGFNEAIKWRSPGLDIQLTPRERELLTPDLMRDVVDLMGMLRPMGVQLTVLSDQPLPEPRSSFSTAERERLRAEVSGIAEASGLRTLS
jgi:hypothetical protein